VKANRRTTGCYGRRGRGRGGVARRVGMLRETAGYTRLVAGVTDALLDTYSAIRVHAPGQVCWVVAAGVVEGADAVSRSARRSARSGWAGGVDADRVAAAGSVEAAPQAGLSKATSPSSTCAWRQQLRRS